MSRNLDGVDLGDSVTAFRSGSVRSASFESGILYDVQPNAQFAEVPYKATLDITLVSNPQAKAGRILVDLLEPHSIQQKSLMLSSLSSHRADELEMKFRAPVTGRASLRIVDSKVDSAEIDTAVLVELGSEAENRN